MDFSGGPPPLVSLMAQPALAFYRHGRYFPANHAFPLAFPHRLRTPRPPHNDHFRSSYRMIIVAFRVLKLPSSRIAAILRRYLSQGPHEQREHLLEVPVSPRCFSTEQWSQL
jgi:hypothetical protein